MTDPAPTTAPDSGGATTPRRRRWRIRLAALGFFAIAGVAAGEAGMRIFRPLRPPNVKTHPLCWHVHRPDLEIKTTNVDTGAVFHYHTNHFGYRGKNMVEEKRPKDTYRIIFVGASTTQGNGLPEESTFAGIVESELDKRRGPGDLRVEVGNASEFGFNSAAVYSMLVHQVLPHEPDMVVFMCGINDLRMSLATVWDEENHFWPPAAPEQPSFNDWLCGVSGFARGVRQASRRLGLTSTDTDEVGYTARKPIVRGVDMTRGLENFRRYLRLTALACKDSKVELVFMTEASIYKELLSPEEQARLWMKNIGDYGDGPNCDVPEFKKGHEGYNEAARVAAAREGTKLVDLERVVPRDLKHFLDDVHLTTAGNAVAAKEILSVVFGEKPAQRRP
ncbi:SGNH/GDSL hydrolase family protein [bacterium]|nr:SGNH/GDSL hydrolase family protein [bacterium]